MTRTHPRAWIGALIGALTLGLLGMAPTVATAETGAQTYCANYGDTTAVTLCEIQYNAGYAARSRLPPPATGFDPTADQQAWDAATAMGTPASYAAYVSGWQQGVTWIDNRIASMNNQINALCPVLPDPSWIPGCIANAKWWLGVYTDARPTAVANAQVANNRAAEIYATFTPRSDGVDAAFKPPNVTVADGSNGIVDGKAQVTISVDGSRFTWREGVGGFTVFATPPQPTPTPTPTPAPAAKAFAKAFAPTISGTVKVGKVLTAKVLTWSPKASFSYQWLRNGTAITGATTSKYTLSGADYKARISVKLTGTRSGYTATSKVSKATKSVKIATMSRGKVKITGTTKVGNVLTAKTYSKWSSGVAFTYQWYRGKTRIPGATTKTYTLTVADHSKKIKVKVTASKTGYLKRSVTSKAAKIS
jgi:hypothetical protein